MRNRTYFTALGLGLAASAGLVAIAYNVVPTSSSATTAPAIEVDSDDYSHIIYRPEFGGVPFDATPPDEIHVVMHSQPVDGLDPYERCDWFGGQMYAIASSVDASAMLICGDVDY